MSILKNYCAPLPVPDARSRRMPASKGSTSAPRLSLSARTAASTTISAASPGAARCGTLLCSEFESTLAYLCAAAMNSSRAVFTLCLWSSLPAPDLPSRFVISAGLAPIARSAPTYSAASGGISALFASPTPLLSCGFFLSPQLGHSEAGAFLSAPQRLHFTFFLQALPPLSSKPCAHASHSDAQRVQADPRRTISPHWSHSS